MFSKNILFYCFFGTDCSVIDVAIVTHFLELDSFCIVDVIEIIDKIIFFVSLCFPAGVAVLFWNILRDFFSY